MPHVSDPAPPSEPAAGVAVPVDQAVAEDLEAIFPSEAAGGPARAARLRLRRRTRAAGGQRSRERRAAGIGALIAAACVGLSAGALIARPSAKTAPPLQSPGAPIALAAGPLAPATPGPLAPAPAQPPAPAPLAAAPEAASAAASRPDRLRPVSAARSGHRPVQAHAGCGRHARCGGDSLKQADARLHRAYVAAARAGVARPVLADYRAEWSRLRVRAPHQPDVVATRYRRMAGDLDQLAAHQRAARAAPTRRGPWQRFRMQLAAMWR